MLLNISSLDFWESRNVISVQAHFVFKHYFCLYTPNIDLGSLDVASSLSLGPYTFPKGCEMAVRYYPGWSQEESQRESGQLLSQTFFFLWHKPPKALKAFCSPLIKLKTQ